MFFSLQMFFSPWLWIFAKNQKYFKFGKKLTKKQYYCFFFKKNAVILFKSIFYKIGGRKICRASQPSCLVFTPERCILLKTHSAFGKPTYISSYFMFSWIVRKCAQFFIRLVVTIKVWIIHHPVWKLFIKKVSITFPDGCLLQFYSHHKLLLNLELPLK